VGAPATHPESSRSDGSARACPKRDGHVRPRGKATLHDSAIAPARAKEVAGVRGRAQGGAGVVTTLLVRSI
jgi:hypothetical protein